MAVREHTDATIERLVQEAAKRKVDFIRGVHAAEQLHNRAREVYVKAVQDANRILAGRVREARLLWSQQIAAADRDFDRLHPALKADGYSSYETALKLATKTRDDVIAKATADCASAMDAAKSILRESGFLGPV